MGKVIIESEIEQVSLDILADMGYAVIHGPDIVPDGTSPERQSYSDVILVKRFVGQSVVKGNI